MSTYIKDVSFITVFLHEDTVSIGKICDPSSMAQMFGNIVMNQEGRKGKKKGRKEEKQDIQEYRKKGKKKRRRILGIQFRCRAPA
jgi:hypothetical protein